MKSVKQQIDEHIESLESETERLAYKLAGLSADAEGKTRIYVDKEKIDELYNKASEIAREVVSLKCANEILYENRGKASAKKSVSSRANGKFGGRPPKEILDAKKRRADLEEKFMNSRLTPEEQKEDEDLMFKISRWERQKREALL